MTGKGEDEAGKMFIGGIARETTEDSLRSYFEKYGQVKDCILMTDKATGHSRGFGFVTFANSAHVDDVIAACPHTLDNKGIDPKRCTPRHMQQKKNTMKSQFNKTHKIFVGGLSMDASDDDVRNYFTKYGVVTEVILVADKNDPTRPHKGFGFVTFEDESSVDQAITKHYHTIKDKRCEAKSAENRDKSQQQNNFNQQPNMNNFNKMNPYNNNQNMAMNTAYPQMNNMQQQYPNPGGYNNNANFNPSFPTQYPQNYNPYANQNPYQQAANPANPGGYNNAAGGYGNYPAQGAMANNGMPAGQQDMSGGYNNMAAAGNNPQQPGANYNANPAAGMAGQQQGRGDMGGMMYGQQQQQNQSSYGPMRGAGGNGKMPNAAGGNMQNYGNNMQQPQQQYDASKNMNNQGANAANNGSGGYHPYRRM